MAVKQPIENLEDVAKIVDTDWGVVGRSGNRLAIGQIHTDDNGQVYFDNPTGLLESTVASCEGSIKQLAQAIGNRGFVLEKLDPGEEGGQRVTYHRIVHYTRQNRNPNRIV